MTELRIGDLLASYLHDPESTWLCGGRVALAEYRTLPDDGPVYGADAARLSVRTHRGALAIRGSSRWIPLAFEQRLAAGAGGFAGWRAGIALCHPRCPERQPSTIAEIGPDLDALLPGGAREPLFTLGVGLGNVEVFVRSVDRRTRRHLRSLCGLSLSALGSRELGELKAGQPHRVFVSPCARVEVYQPIPPPDGQSPAGPHTHVRAGLIGRRIPPRHQFGGRLPLPAGVEVGLLVYPPVVYPPAPRERWEDGVYDPAYDQTYHQADQRAGDRTDLGFERALAQWGAPGWLAAKRRFHIALAGGGPPELAICPTADERDAVAIAVAQAAARGGPTALLARWARALSDPPG